MPPTAPRHLALDVLRGLTLALMIVVNTPGSWGSIYSPLAHAAWHGFTLTDLVFPSFLFVVGGALRLNMKKFATQDDALFLRTVFKRAVLIFLCGLLLYFFAFESVRIMGVLQRIALCYLSAALIVRYGGVRGAVLASAVLLLGYWWLLWRFGDYSLVGNVVRAVDLAVLGAPHMYGGEGIPFDPEGLVSTLPAVVNVLGGYLAIAWLERRSRAVPGLLVAGAACLLLALVWDAALPINKKLWTGSYVALTVGLDLVILALLAWAIDGKSVRAGTGFFVVFGKNTLFIYMLSSAGAMVLGWSQVGDRSLHAWLYEEIFQGRSAPYLASLLFALAYMLACWLVAYAMDRRGLYVKL